jgi:hypothetical protein
VRSNGETSRGQRSWVPSSRITHAVLDRILTTGRGKCVRFGSIEACGIDRTGIYVSDVDEDVVAAINR